jgi:putative aminopeptidase FrvX
MPMPEILRALLTTPGPSGYEQPAARVWRVAAGRFSEKVAGDVMGSSVALVDGTGDGPLLAVVGHIDEIGLIVTHIDDDGMLWFTGVGGWDAQILVGQRVEVVTRDGPRPGVVGKKPIHLLKDDERKKVAEIKDLHIDVGAKDGDEARTLVSIGDVAVIAGEPVEMPNGRVISRSMDNRLGSYVALETARLVAESGGAPGAVAGVAVVQEEITFAGAKTTAFSLEPKVAVVVDVTHATDAPGIDPKEVGGKHPLGSGPVITRGSTIHPAVFSLLRETAEAEGIPFTVEAAARATGTDADAFFVSRAGIPTAVVSIPLRYMHSPVEMVELADVEACARLIAAFAGRLSGETLFER